MMTLNIPSNETLFIHTKKGTVKITPEMLSSLAEEQNKKTKEDRFKELIDGIKPVVDFEKYPTSIFWLKEDNFYFEYDWKTNNFWINWNLVWSVFQKEYSMKYNDIQSFMKIVVEEHFKLKGVTPDFWKLLKHTEVEEHFKLKGVTPIDLATRPIIEVEEHFKIK